MRNIRYMLEGYGSILFIIPQDIDDRSNILSDWRRVGEYLWHSIIVEAERVGRKERGISPKSKTGEGTI